MSGNVVLLISFLVAVFWIILLAIPFGWHKKSTHIWNFWVGLYHVEVDSKTLLGAVAKYGLQKTDSELIQALGKVFADGQGDLQSYKDSFCNGDAFVPGNRMCKAWDDLFWGSTFEIFAIGLTDLFLLIGSGFCYFYWHEESREYQRIGATACYTLAPVTAFGGLVVYGIFSQGFCGFLTDIGLSHGGYTFSWSFYCAAVLVLFTCAPVCILLVYGGKSQMEDLHEAMAQQQRDQAGLYGAQEAAAQYHSTTADPYYGATAATTGAPQQQYGGYPPQQQAPPQQHQQQYGGYTQY